VILVYGEFEMTPEEFEVMEEVEETQDEIFEDASAFDKAIAQQFKQLDYFGIELI